MDYWRMRDNLLCYTEAIQQDYHGFAKIAKTIYTVFRKIGESPFTSNFVCIE